MSLLLVEYFVIGFGYFPLPPQLFFTTWCRILSWILIHVTVQSRRQYLDHTRFHSPYSKPEVVVGKVLVTEFLAILQYS